LIRDRTVQEMKFPGARYGLKMACCENPKRVYHTRGPSTRMGNMAGYREAFSQAEAYRRRWDKWNKDHQGDPPDRNLRLETLAEVLRGNIYVQNHCYRADEMAQMRDLAREFGFRIRSFHHAVEAYKIADLLARDGTSVSVWADWWGFKEEAMDGIHETAALNQAAGGRPLIHSDSPSGIQGLNQEAAKAMHYGQRSGMPVTRDHALRFITANPARARGRASVVVTPEPGEPQAGRRTGIEARGKWVTPGVIDGGTQLGLTEISAVNATNEGALRGSDVAAAFNVAEGINPASTLIPVTRVEGVTTTLAAPASGWISGQAVLIDLDGATIEQMLVRSPVGMLVDLSEGSKSAGGGSRAGVAQRLRRVFSDALEYSRRRTEYTRAPMQQLAPPAAD